MSFTRLYQPIFLSPDTTIRLDEKASHHLVRVLRASLQDKVTVFNGEGGEYEGIITRIDKKYVEVKLIAFHARETKSPINISLAQGIARGEKMDFIVQKATELGVTTIIPLWTERSSVRFDAAREAKRLKHWQAVARSACEQSGRNDIPQVMAPIRIEEWLLTVNATIAFVLSPHCGQLLKETKLAPNNTIAVLIGPEGGLSDHEIEKALMQGFTPLNLGPRILRTETAPIAILSILQAIYGDMR